MQRYRCEEKEEEKEEENENVKIAYAKTISFPVDFDLRQFGSFKDKAVFLPTHADGKWTMGKDEGGALIVFLEKVEDAEE